MRERILWICSFHFRDSIYSKSFRKDEWLQLYSRESRINKNDQLDWRRSCNSTLQNCTLLNFLCLHLYETILVCVNYIEGSLFVEKKWSLVIFENVKIPGSTPSHLRLNEGNTGIKMARNFLLYDNDIFYIFFLRRNLTDIVLRREIWSLNTHF